MSQGDDGVQGRLIDWTRCANYMRVAFYVAQPADRSCQVSLASREALLALDRKRRANQAALCQIFDQYVHVCGNCGGKCCGATTPVTSHYYGIDFWLRRFGPDPTPHLERIWVENPVIVFAKQKLRRLMRSKSGDQLGILRLRNAFRTSRKKGEESHGASALRCMHLGEAGCAFSPADRPISCIVYACGSLLESISAEQYAQAVLHMEALRQIHQDTLAVLRKEKAIGFFAGRFRLGFVSRIRLEGMLLIKHMGA